jgi:tyrosinase
MRRNHAWVGLPERASFYNAVMALKGKQQDGTNLYDMYVNEHRDAAFAGHRGPAFFAWHRQFLKSFEDALQSVSNELQGLLYWDWSVAKAAPVWPFGQDFLGTDGRASDGKVMDGMFAYDAGHWNLNIRSNLEPPYLRRQFGINVSSLPGYTDYWTTLAQTPYDTGAFWDTRSGSGFRNMAEGWIPGPEAGMHNRVHMYVGGSMLPMSSPNDPVFWLHHCFVDKLWAVWQVKHQNDSGYQPYLPTAGANSGHNLNDEMAFDLPNMAGKTFTPAQELSHRALGYRYDTEDYLLPGEELYPGQWITSASSTYVLWCWSDRCGVTLNAVGAQRQPWAAPTNPLGSSGGPACRLMLKNDGNLVLYDPAKGPNDPNPPWQTGAANRSVSRLRVLDDGHIALYDSSNKQIWSRPPPQAG